MGQAKARGSFEQRQAEALFYKSERERLDAWLKSRRPKVKINNKYAERLAAVFMAHGVHFDITGRSDW